MVCFLANVGIQNTYYKKDTDRCTKKCMHHCKAELWFKPQAIWHCTQNIKLYFVTVNSLKIKNVQVIVLRCFGKDNMSLELNMRYT